MVLKTGVVRDFNVTLANNQYGNKKVGIEFNSATKSKETRNKILGRENILVWDNLQKFNPYFWQTYCMKWAKSRN